MMGIGGLIWYFVPNGDASWTDWRWWLKCMSLPAVLYSFFPNCQDSLYLTPRGRKNHHWQILLECHDPQNEHQRRIIKFHANLNGQIGGIETSPFVDKRSGGKNIVLDDKYCLGKVKDVPVDIELFHLLERFMRYRVGINPTRGKPMTSSNYSAVEGSLDYICQDVVIDTFSVLGLFKGGRAHWDGFSGVMSGVGRVFGACGSPFGMRDAWFQNTDDFIKKYLLNQNALQVGKMYKPYKDPTEKQGLKIQTTEQGTEEETSIWFWIGLFFVLLAIGLLIWYFFQREDDDEEAEDLMQQLERLRNEKLEKQRQTDDIESAIKTAGATPAGGDIQVDTKPFAHPTKEADGEESPSSAKERSTSSQGLPFVYRPKFQAQQRRSRSASNRTKVLLAHERSREESNRLDDEVPSRTVSGHTVKTPDLEASETKSGTQTDLYN